MNDRHEMTSVEVGGAATNGGATATEPSYMTSAEVLKLLRIESLITLQRYIKAGLPAHQPIPGGQRLFDRAEVIAWIKSRWIATTPDPDAR